MLHLNPSTSHRYPTHYRHNPSFQVKPSLASFSLGPHLEDAAVGPRPSARRILTNVTGSNNGELISEEGGFSRQD